MNRIEQKFSDLKHKNEKALVGFLTAGDPDYSRSLEIICAMCEAGLDILELGVPFSDPTADGPVIQRASERALKAGASLRKILDVASRIRERSEIPILLFSYLNPVLRFGLEELAAEASARGIDGCLLTDMSVEEAQEYVEVMRRHQLDTVFLATPTSPPERLRLVADYSSGFVYLVSRTGVTGEQSSLSDQVVPLARRVRAVTDLPLAIGFGISKPEHAREAGALSEGVVVGSAFVHLVEEASGDPSLEGKLETLARQLKEALPATVS